MQSITVDGVTYTFHPTTNTITTSNGSTANYDGTTLTVDTDPSAVGGELAVVMTTGAFTFKPTQNFTSESVGYVLVDNDGDTAANTVVISASGAVAPAGVAGEAISLGLTNPAGHVGAMNVSIAGLPAGWSLSEGTDNGDGSWTVQSNDIAALTVSSPGRLHWRAGAACDRKLDQCRRFERSYGAHRQRRSLRSRQPDLCHIRQRPFDRLERRRPVRVRPADRR